MKNSILLPLFLFFAFVSCDQSKNTQASTDAAIALPLAKKPNEQVLRHVVLFKFKDSSTDTDIQQIVEGFKELPEKIDEILDFEWGTDISPEGLSNEYTHCFILTFEDESSRDAYLPHPAHEAFVGQIGPHIEKVLVIDYWAQK